MLLTRGTLRSHPLAPHGAIRLRLRTASSRDATGSPRGAYRSTRAPPPPPIHPDQTRHTLLSLAPISRSSTPHTNTHLATCTLRGRGERAARSKTSSDLTVRPGVRARVRARAGSERRERTSWGSRVCPDCTVCLSVCQPPLSFKLSRRSSSSMSRGGISRCAPPRCRRVRCRAIAPNTRVPHACTSPDTRVSGVSGRDAHRFVSTRALLGRACARNWVSTSACASERADTTTARARPADGAARAPPRRSRCACSRAAARDREAAAAAVACRLDRALRPAAARGRVRAGAARAHARAEPAALGRRRVGRDPRRRARHPRGLSPSR